MVNESEFEIIQREALVEDLEFEIKELKAKVLVKSKEIERLNKIISVLNYALGDAQDALKDSFSYRVYYLSKVDT